MTEETSYPAYPTYPTDDAPAAPPADAPVTIPVTEPPSPPPATPPDAPAAAAEPPEPSATPEPAPTAAGVTVGRIVHVVLDRGANTGDCRPAIVVRVWNPETINAQMFSDGLNDHMDYAGGMVWLTSLRYAKPVAGQPTPAQTWHWAWED